MEKKERVGQNGQFKDRMGFILASVGSAVGMGNIWLFPYRVGQYGGAAFLLVYFLFVALFGYVGLSGEFAFGRLTRTGPIGSYDYALKQRGKKGGGLIGAVPLFGSLGIAIGYAIIVGWVFRYIVGAVSGNMMHGAAGLDGAALNELSGQYFSQITGHFGSFGWHAAVILIAMLVLTGGVMKGIEKLNKILMPSFFILFLLIAIRVAFLPGAIEGYRYLLVPDWSYLLVPETWIMAMGQAFFSLSITGSGMIIYGSYLDKKEDIPKAAVTTAILDTLAALLAGFAIIPAVFAFGLDPKSGPPLMFITLPIVFSKIPMGNLVAAIFFIAVLFAGITSLVNMFEVCTEALQTHVKWNRKVAVAAVGCITFLVGLFIEYEPYMGKWMDIITIYVTPFGAVLCAIVIYWGLGVGKIKDELNQGRQKPLPKVFFFLAKYVYVILAVLVCILSIQYKGIG